MQKGQRVKIGEPVKVSFFRQVAPGATLMYEDILYACDEDVCPEYTKDPRIKEVVTLTSDLSRKNLEKDFERMDTPQGTFYRKLPRCPSNSWCCGSRYRWWLIIMVQVFTSTSSLPSMAASLMQSWSARERSWDDAQQGSGKAYTLAEEGIVREGLYPESIGIITNR